MLPDPPTTLKNRSDELTSIIRDKIQNQGGWMSAESFMEMCLYYPQLGYYSSGLEKLGEEGDFVTAPILGNLFAKCVGKQCDEIFEKVSDLPRVIVEFGAGGGQLAADVIKYFESLAVPLDHYFIMETSPYLMDQQRETLTAAGVDVNKQVSWLLTLEELPGQAIIVGNELLDAMPAKQFTINAEGQPVERGVKWIGDGFKWADSDLPMPGSICERLSSYELPIGYHSEVLLQAEGWVKTVSERLERGVIILIDYGFTGTEYYHPHRDQGSMMCHFRHQAHDNPFLYPGLQDITVHVDFSAVKLSAEQAGMQLIGFSSQGAFLLSLGILDHLQAMQQQSEIDTKEMLDLSQQIKKLTLPHEMGELFKVIVFCTEPLARLKGFELQNHQYRL